MIKTQHSPVHGTGVFAATHIAQGQRLGTYEGRRYTARQATRRDWDPALTYVFGLSDGSMIDGSDGGNETRHLNHSCEPNCEAHEEVGPRGRLSIVFYALGEVRAGDELFIDYGLLVDEPTTPAEYQCGCRSLRCRGTMLASAPDGA
jgi:hypothetical protein